jgi:cobalamin biosynthesis protein CbiD
MLKFIGAITTIAAAAAAAYAAVLVVESLPDIQRYLKIRSM